MRDSDWSRQNLLRSDWSGPSVALITTQIPLGTLKGKQNVQAKEVYFTVGRLIPCHLILPFIPVYVPKERIHRLV